MDSRISVDLLSCREPRCRALPFERASPKVTNHGTQSEDNPASTRHRQASDLYVLANSPALHLRRHFRVILRNPASHQMKV